MVNVEPSKETDYRCDGTAKRNAHRRLLRQDPEDNTRHHNQRQHANGEHDYGGLAELRAVCESRVETILHIY